MQKLQLYIRKALLATVICLSCVQAYTQTPEFAPIGAKWWYYFRQDGFDPSWPRYTLEVEKDTVFLGIPCRKVISTMQDGSLPFPADQHFYIYQSNDTVFVSVEDSFSILYKLNPIPGDSWIMSLTNYQYGNIGPMTPLEVYVDSISYITFFDLEFQVSYIHMTDWTTLCIYDSIISLFGNPNYLFPSYCNMPDGYEPLGLTCFYHPEYGLLNFDGGDCDFVIDIESTEIGYNIYYDVLSAQIKISTLNFNPLIRFALYDISGKLLQSGMEQSYGFNISMLNYAKGIYLLQINTESSSTIYKILK